MTAESYTAKILIQPYYPTEKDEYRTVNFSQVGDLATFLRYLIVGVKCTQPDPPEKRRYSVWTGKFIGSSYTRNTKRLTAEVCGDKEFIDYCLSRYRPLHLGMTRARLIINGKKRNLFDTGGQKAWHGYISAQVISVYEFEHARTQLTRLISARAVSGTPVTPAPSIP